MATFQMVDESDASCDVTMRAETAMATKYVAVMLGTNEGYVDLVDAVTDKPYGILQTTAAAAGDPVVVRPIFSGKRSLVKANGAFSKGDLLAIAAAGGKVDTVASTTYPLGIALAAATADNDEVTAQLGAAWSAAVS